MFVEAYFQEGAHHLKIYQKDKDSKLGTSLVGSKNHKKWL